MTFLIVMIKAGRKEVAPWQNGSACSFDISDFIKPTIPELLSELEQYVEKTKLSGEFQCLKMSIHILEHIVFELQSIGAEERRAG